MRILIETIIPLVYMVNGAVVVFKSVGVSNLPKSSISLVLKFP
jgi:hypothetical protein